MWYQYGVMTKVALALALALGLAVVSGAAQRSTILTNGRNLQIPINHGLPDKPLGFTFCRLRYENIRRARKSGWGDDYPQVDYTYIDKRPLVRDIVPGSYADKNQLSPRVRTVPSRLCHDRCSRGRTGSDV